MLVRRTNSLLDNVIDEWNRAIDEKAAGIPLALDVHETDEHYVVSADIPGVNAEDIDMRLHDNVLTISAETSYQNREENDNVLIQERRYGKFSRSLRFASPVDGDAIEADYTNGVLTVTVPKAEEAKPRRITINGNGASRN